MLYLIFLFGVDWRMHREHAQKWEKIQDASNIQAGESESFISSQEEENDEINAIWKALQASPIVPHYQYLNVLVVQSQQPSGHPY